MSNQESDYYIEPLNVLSFPKGKAPKCELTGYPATCKLQSPEITLVSVEGWGCCVVRAIVCVSANPLPHPVLRNSLHAEQAWHGIINKIAGLLGPLRSNAVIVGSEEDRAKREYTVNMSKRALIDLCQQEASKMLVNQQYSLAIPGAIQALAFLKDIYGDGSIESVPPYLLLAEANLGLSKFQQCEEFLR